MAGHLAFLKTYLRIQDKYYWPHMKREIKEYCKACIKCAINKPAIHRDPSNPLPVADAPFSTIAIDFIGPLNQNPTLGNNCVMVVTDYLTK